MASTDKPIRESEAGDAGAARRSAERPPRQDRDRWENFDIDEVRKTRADAPPPETPISEEDQRAAGTCFKCLRRLGPQALDPKPRPPTARLLPTPDGELRALSDRNGVWVLRPQPPEASDLM